MNIGIQNYPINNSYNTNFKSKKIVTNTAPLITGALLTTTAALTRPLNEATKQRLLLPDDYFELSTERWLETYYGPKIHKAEPYTPEKNFSNKSAKESAMAMISGSKFTSKNIIKDNRGRIIKIVKEFEPAFTVTKTFDYESIRNNGSVTITTDHSFSGSKDIEKYRNGKLIEKYTTDKNTNKFYNKELYVYNEDGNVSKRLSYTTHGDLWEYEYMYDKDDRIISVKITQTDIPKEERDNYCYPKCNNEKIINYSEYKYDKKGNPILTKHESKYITANGKTYNSTDNYDIGFYNPNEHVKLKEYKLNN